MPLVWRVTNRCNLNCWFCRAKTTEPCKGSFSSQEIDYQTIIKVCKEFSSLENFDKSDKKYVFTGGEPFVRTDTILFLEELSYDLNLPIRVITNGTLIDRRLANRLAKSNIEIMVSLDGTHDAHDKMRNAPCYTQTLKGICNLLSAGVNTNIATTVTTDNIEAVRSTDFLDLLKSLNGVKGIALGTLDYIGLARNNYHRKISDSELTKIKENMNSCLNNIVFCRESIIPSLRIDSAGNVFACGLFEGDIGFSDGNITHEKLEDIILPPSICNLFRKKISNEKMLCFCLQVLHQKTALEGKELAMELAKQIQEIKTFD